MRISSPSHHRLLLETLEDRLPPGQASFGSLGMALLGPSLSLLQLDALASEGSGVSAAPVVQQPTQTGSWAVETPVDSSSTLVLNNLSGQNRSDTSASVQASIRTDLGSDPTSAAESANHLDTAGLSALSSSRTGFSQVYSSGTPQASTAAVGTVGGTAPDSRFAAPQPFAANTSANENQSRDALIVASTLSSSSTIHSVSAKGIGGSVSAQDVSINPNVRVNSRANCGGGRGIIQSETSLATTSTPSGNEAIVVSYNDFRAFYCAGSNYQVTGWGYSLDGGQTFADGGPLPGRTSLSGDGWLATGPDGTIYLASLYNGLGSLAVLRGTATDTGINWSNPTIITGGGSYDKEAITVDQNDGTIYLSYTRFGGPGGINLYRSQDGGLSFQGPFTVSTTPQAQGSSPAVGPNGELYVAYGIGYPSDSGIGFAASYDQGLTWTDSHQIAPVRQFAVSGSDRSPAFPHIAVDTTGGSYTGTIYISYQSANLSGKGDALLTSSNDGGATWNAPFQINDDGGVGIQWQPTISVDANGYVNSFFYDRRDHPGTTQTNLYFAQSTDGGQSFNANVLATDVASSWHAVGDGTPAWGDYMNAISDGADTIVAHVDGRDGDPDAYFTRASAV